MSSNKKYELLDSNLFHELNGRPLKRVRALAAIPSVGVKPGDLGGYIEAEKNLQVTGNAWVIENARVLDDAYVSDSARVFGNARVCGNARIFGDSRVSGHAAVSGDARVFGNAKISGQARVSGDSRISGNAEVSGDAWVMGEARIDTRAHVGWFSNVGPWASTLTWFRTSSGLKIYQDRFDGTLDEFEAAIFLKHSDDQIAREYRCLIDFIRIRSASFSHGEVPRD